MSCVLGFATYPIKYPVHGGQRRVAAFADFYNRLGLNYESICIYEPLAYPASAAGPHDVPLGYVDGGVAGVPFLNDLLSGMYGSREDHIFEHFLKVVRAKSPVALVLEQPFMWPLVERLRRDPAIRKIPLIYSSQNWEGPLKRTLLRKENVESAVAVKIAAEIEEIERSAVRASQLIFAVSDHDAEIYRKIDPGKLVLVVNNGVARPRAAISMSQSLPVHFRDSRYLFFVGSAYPPNIDGICDLLLDGGLFFLPPRIALAICGGVAHRVFQDARYQRFLGSNTRRVFFYPTVSDGDLEILKSHAHAVLLPINFGGGSNLKTAEALASGKWVVATSTAMRGFENFMSEPGVVIADGRSDFRKAVIKIYNSPPLELSDASKKRRESVYWDCCFDGLSLADLGLSVPGSDRPAKQMSL